MAITTLTTASELSWRPFCNRRRMLRQGGGSFGLLASSSMQRRDEIHLSLSRGYTPGDQTRPIYAAPEAAGLQLHCEGNSRGHHGSSQPL
ncbi:hypothetical protein AVEN_30130-1 [Araneus ventricosus]|uniref:Uncharacterized protein n=1 Tax=Araneus ventricosus TaxID=182803 RepID=A0A4Y2SHE1_ARAVE|nr:hypothetical protein AVEN_30130-1 [Araneus ventricosus]